MEAGRESRRHKSTRPVGLPNYLMDFLGAMRSPCTLVRERGGGKSQGNRSTLAGPRARGPGRVRSPVTTLMPNTWKSCMTTAPMYWRKRDVSEHRIPGALLTTANALLPASDEVCTSRDALQRSTRLCLGGRMMIGTDSSHSLCRECRNLLWQQQRWTGCLSGHTEDSPRRKSTQPSSYRSRLHAALTGVGRLR